MVAVVFEAEAHRPDHDRVEYSLSGYLLFSIFWKRLGSLIGFLASLSIELCF